MKTILVTGANGFLGTHTLAWLSQQSGIQLIAACRDKSKLSHTFKGEIREGNICDETYLKTLLDGVDVVVNAMSWSSLHGHKNQSHTLFYLPNQKLIDAYMQSNATGFVNISSTSAAAPAHSKDASSKGIQCDFWPHLNNVIKIENDLRQKATSDKSVINLRLGIFVGEHYGLGVLPILIPRLKTHLVPWVEGGNTQLPLTDGRDLGQAIGRAALIEKTNGFLSINVVGQDIPTVREVITFLNQEYGYPKPHFSVPFWIAYPFAWLMEKLNPITFWEPLIVRSIIHLLENTNVNNDKAKEILSYQPQYHWQDAIRLQVAEMERKQTKPMSMVKAVN